MFIHVFIRKNWTRTLIFLKHKIRQSVLKNPPKSSLCIILGWAGEMDRSVHRELAAEAGASGPQQDCARVLRQHYEVNCWQGYICYILIFPLSLEEHKIKITTGENRKKKNRAKNPGSIFSPILWWKYNFENQIENKSIMRLHYIRSRLFQYIENSSS